MIRTYLAVMAMVIYIFINTLFFLPFLFFLNEKKGVLLTKIIKKNYGHFVMWLINAKVEVCYENLEMFKKTVENEPVVVVANHQSFVDIPLLCGYLDMNVGFVAKEEIKKWGLFNLWMERARCVFLDRRSPREALKSFNAAINFVKEGKSVCIFPEGTRSIDGNVGEFKKGSFKLALEPKVKILPVSIKGTYEIMNKHKFFINFGKKIKLIIGEPIDIVNLNREELKEINRKVREKIIWDIRSV